MTFDEKLSDENVIFHYTTSAIAFEKILPFGKMRYSSLENTNDPLEYKRLYLNANIWSDGSNEQRELIHNTKSHIESVRKAGCKMACFSSNNNEEIDNTDFNFSSIRYLGCAKSRMWSQYGDSHKGIVLVFDKNKLLKELALRNYQCLEIYSDDIQYTGFDFKSFPVMNGERIKKVGKDIFTREFLKEYHKLLFFTKDSDYKDEKEYRIVVFTEPEVETFMSISTSLIGIVIGDRFPDGLMPNLKYYAEKYKVNCRRIWWEKGVPSLLFCNPHSEELFEGFNIPEQDL